MIRRFVLALLIVPIFTIAGTALGQQVQDIRPGSALEFTLRGGGAEVPAQAEAAAAGARQAEAEAAKIETQAQEERGRESVRRLNQDALGQRDAPLRNFGVLSGPLSPTVPGVRH